MEKNRFNNLAMRDLIGDISFIKDHIFNELLKSAASQVAPNQIDHQWRHAGGVLVSN